MLQSWLLALLWVSLSLASAHSANMVGKQKFCFDSQLASPKILFTSQVLAELKRLHLTESDSLPQNASRRLDQLFRIYEREIKHTGSIIRNYYLSGAEVDKLSYYLVQVFEKLARISPDSESIQKFLYEYALTGDDDEVAFLLRSLYEKSDLRTLLTRVFCELIEERRLFAFRRMLTNCPELVHERIEWKLRGQSLTPLAVAASESAPEMVRDLIDAGADVNVMVIEDASYGEIPVIFCVFTDYLEADLIIQLFLESPRFRKDLCVDSHGLSPAFYIFEKGLHTMNLDVAASVFGWSESISNETALLDAFGFAISLGLEAHAEILTFAHDFDVEKIDANGSTYLMLAAQHNQPEAIKLIFSHPDAKQSYKIRPGYTNMNGSSAMSIAIAFRAYEALVELLKHASENEINNESGANPLAWSIYFSDEKSLQLILKHPAIRLDALMNANIPGFTVLEYAQNIGNPVILHHLQEFARTRTR